MARKSAICPPGVWCLTPTLGVLLVVAIVISLFILYQSLQVQQITPVVQQRAQRQQPPVQVLNNTSSGGDDRYTRSPEPLRFWQTQPDIRGAMLPPGAVPINVSTRGLPQSFQQMGIIKADDKLLPLYGRQTAYRSDRYNYYTRTDTYNPVQLPIRYQRRDCMDSIGCEELFGGESVKVSGLNQDGRVEVYNFDGPTYIPGIV